MKDRDQKKAKAERKKTVMQAIVKVLELNDFAVRLSQAFPN